MLKDEAVVSRQDNSRSESDDEGQVFYSINPNVTNELPRNEVQASEDQENEEILEVQENQENISEADPYDIDMEIEEIEETEEKSDTDQREEDEEKVKREVQMS